MVDSLRARVEMQLRRAARDDSPVPKRVLLVLDGCETGQMLEQLKTLLNPLFRALPNLTAALTIRATDLVTEPIVPIMRNVAIQGLSDER